MDHLYAEPTHPPLVEGIVVKAPASLSDKVSVVIPSFNDGHVYGPAPWATRGGQLPRKGARCVVALDEHLNPWILSWEGAGEESDLVSTLPASPYDGQTVAYQSAAMATAGVVWRLRYRAASASAYKWEFLGGGELSNEVVADEETASGAYVDLATVGPSVTAPLAGDYMVRFGARLAVLAAACNPVAQLFIGASEAGKFLVAGHAAETSTSAFCEALLTGQPAAAVLRLKYASEGAKPVRFARRVLTINPIRVG